MPFWRRRDDEPAHERLAREAGIDLDAQAAAPPEGPFPPGERAPFTGSIREPGIHGIHRQRQWDAVATAEVAGLPGDELDFVALPDGTILVDDALPDGVAAALADALEQSLAPPYRARAVRRGGDLWGVAANRIDVVEVPEPVAGDNVSLVVQGGDRTLLVDERPGWDPVPTLEALALARHREFVLHADRLDGDLWAVKVNPL